jgi:putative transposase
LNSISAKLVNRIDGTPGRKVWHQYWDTHLSYAESFLARLRYVHTNPAKHGLVANPELYEWCSAAWFRRTTKSFHGTVMSFRSDALDVPDNYDLAPV